MAIVNGHIQCGACGEVKPLDAFYPSIAAQGRGRCRLCAKAAWRNARAADPDRFRGYRKAYVERNPNAARASMKRWEGKKKADYAASGPRVGSMKCSSCLITKSAAMFVPSAGARGSGVCRQCKQEAKKDYYRRNPDKAKASANARRQRNVESYRAAQRARYRSDPERFRSYNLGKYGITAADYDAMLAAQGGGCACCGATQNRSGKRLFVDHDHATGAVRGLLCHHCNAGIGHLGDTAEGVRRALNYLERAPQQAPRRTAPSMRFNLLPGAN